jgi:hypothetical protein
MFNRDMTHRLLLGILLSSVAFAGITMDNDQTHGHPKEYFAHVREKYKDD